MKNVFDLEINCILCYFYEFLRIEGSVEILSHGDRFRNTNSCSIDSLPDVSKIYSSSDFLNQYRS